MTAPVFIGDEVTATGYRLAGARTIVPLPGDAPKAFEAAREAAELLLITASCAAEIPEWQLERAVRTGDPLVLLVPDAGGHVMPVDLSIEVDRALGIES